MLATSRMDDHKLLGKHEWRMRGRKKSNQADAGPEGEFKLSQDVQEFLSKPSSITSAPSVGVKESPPLVRKSLSPWADSRSSTLDEDPFDDSASGNRPSSSEGGEPLEGVENSSKRRAWKERLKKHMQKTSESNAPQSPPTLDPGPQYTPVSSSTWPQTPSLRQLSVPGRASSNVHTSVMSPTRVLPLQQLGRLDISNASRWPTSQPMREISPDPQSQSLSQPEAQTVAHPTLKRSKGLRVSFTETRPEIIGEGGDEADTPPIEVSKFRGQQGLPADQGFPPPNNEDDTLDEAAAPAQSSSPIPGEEATKRIKRAPSPVVLKRKPTAGSSKTSQAPKPSEGSVSG